jgi:nucleoid-associated protein YgaU
VNRAIGLIRNARSTISSSARRINALATSVSSLGSTVTAEFSKTVATVKSVNHIHDIRYNYGNLAGLLASLESQFAALRKTIPLQRHLVITGDTLQKLSNKYYNTPDHWQDIYDHNKLTTTLLVVGSVLEIPKV